MGFGKFNYSRIKTDYNTIQETLDTVQNDSENLIYTKFKEYITKDKEYKSILNEHVTNLINKLVKKIDKLEKRIDELESNNKVDLDKTKTYTKEVHLGNSIKNNTIKLSYLPEQSSIRLYLNCMYINTTDYFISGKNIVLSLSIQDDDIIEIEYERFY